MLLLSAAPSRAALDLGYAKEDGGRPGAFLDFAAGARSMGMGRAYTAVAEDASANYWNPAGLAQIQRIDIVADYSALWEDSSFGVFNYAQPTVDHGTFGLGLVNLRSGNYDKRDDNGGAQGSFNTSELGILLSHGIDINDRLALGGTAKFIQEKVDAFSGTGYGLDGGLMYRLRPNLQAGLTFRNILAPRIKLDQENDTYPFEARLGVRTMVFRHLLVATDLSQTQGRSVKLNLGGEWSFNDLLAFRVGINETEMSAGIGMKFKDWGVDYAFGYQDAAAGLADLGASHRFGVHINFGKRVFEQQASVRWQNKGEAVLASLRNKMQNSTAGVTDNSVEKTVDTAKQVISRQGFLKPQDLYEVQGYVSYFEKDYERSVQSLRAALELNPNNQMLSDNLVKARAEMTSEQARNMVKSEIKTMKSAYAAGDWRGALKSCEKILSFDPSNIEAATYKDDAIARINEPIDREMKIGKAKLEREEYLDAIKSFQKVKEMAPENKEASDLITQSIAALEKKSSDQAMAPAEPSDHAVYEIERNPQQSRLFYSKALMLYSQGKVKEAAGLWQESLRVDPTNSLARNALTRATNELKDAGDGH